MHGAGQLAQRFQGDIFPSGVSVVSFVERLHQFRQAHDLHSVKLPEAFIPVIDGQTYMGIFLQTDKLFASLTEHPEAVVMPAVLDRGAAYVVSRPGGQSAGVVRPNIFFHHGPQFVWFQLDADGVFFLPVVDGSLIFCLGHANPSQPVFISIAYRRRKCQETGRKWQFPLVDF